MSKFLYTILLCFLFFSVSAQEDDSLFVVAQGKTWVMPYTTGANETVFMVARRFHVPPAVLGSMNSIDYKSTFATGARITVPIAAYNFMREKPNDMIDAEPLYYIVKEDDDLLRICHISGVSQQVMERWNSLPDNNIYIGHSLFVGWVLYDATSGRKGIITSVEGGPAAGATGTASKNYSAAQNDSKPQKPNPESEWPGMQQKQARPGAQQVMDRPQEQAQRAAGEWHDTVIVIKRKPADTSVQSQYEELYLSQTGNEVNAANEKGSAAFFNSQSKAPGVYYAFHNDLARGVIIKVHNPGTDKTVYAKVIGPLPATRQYYNCIMAISGNAREELGVQGDKVWCEISYR